MRDKIMTYVNEVGDAIGAHFYLVGGTVRDELLGKPTKDWDLVARGLPWDDLMTALRQYGKTEATGEQFNVIRHFPRERSLPALEIALPRKEYSTGVKTTDFEARYDHEMPIEDDLLRRDYSINSIAMCCKTGQLIDPFDGKGDLNRGVLRMLHPDSAKDDPLRIIRGVRFMARFGYGVTPETDRQLRDHVKLLYAVSGERFQKELLDMIVAPHVDVALRYMQEIGALKEVFPELEACVGCTQNHYHEYDVWEHTVQAVKHCPSIDPYVKLGMLFHDIGKEPTKWIGPDGVAHFYEPEPGQEFLVAPRIPGNHELVGADMTWHIMGQKRLKFSAQHQSRVTLFVREHMFGRDPKFSARTARRFLSRLEGTPGGIEANMEALFDIRTGDTLGGKSDASHSDLDVDFRFRDLCRHELSRQTAFKVTDLAVNGHDLMALGLRGPEIGKAQRQLLDVVIDDPDLNERDTLIALVSEG